MNDNDGRIMMATKTSLNLRNYGALTENDLARLPATVRRLWIGPYFCSELTCHKITLQLPVAQLTHLDLDLSNVAVGSVEEIQQAVAALFQHCSSSDNTTTSSCQLVRLGLRMHAPPPVHLDNNTMHQQQQQPQDSLASSSPGDSLALAVASHVVPRTTRTTTTIVSTLQTLDLHGNRIGDTGVLALVEALRNSTAAAVTIKHLNLSYNHLTDTSCQALAGWLQQQQSDSSSSSPTSDVGCCPLQSLDVSYNPVITETGFLSLIEALQRNTSLRALSGMGCPQLRHHPHSAYGSTNDSAKNGLTNSHVDIYQQLAQCLKRHNYTLESIHLSWPPQSTTVRSNVHDTTATSDSVSIVQVAYYLALNRAGRRVLRCLDGSSGSGHTAALVPHILANVSATTSTEPSPTTAATHRFYFLRQTVPLWTPNGY